MVPLGFAGNRGFAVVGEGCSGFLTQEQLVTPDTRADVDVIHRGRDVSGRLKDAAIVVIVIIVVIIIWLW